MQTNDESRTTRLRFYPCAGAYWKQMPDEALNQKIILQKNDIALERKIRILLTIGVNRYYRIKWCLVHHFILKFC